MALQQTQNTIYGFTIDDAYQRIELVTILGKSSLRFAVRSYQNDSAEKFFDEEYFACQYDINGDNPIKQAYNHIKTLDKFKNALDV